MPRRPDPRLLEPVLLGIVLVVSLTLITPWGSALRHSLMPRMAILVIVIGTLAGAASLVSGLVAAFSDRGGARTAALPLSLGVGLLLLAASFLPSERGSPMQSVSLWGAAFFMVVVAVLQGRATERRQ
jgi:hypothetical protein